LVFDDHVRLVRVCTTDAFRLRVLLLQHLHITGQLMDTFRGDDFAGVRAVFPGVVGKELAAQTGMSRSPCSGTMVRPSIIAKTRQ
jgi:hypothetical protein